MNCANPDDERLAQLLRLLRRRQQLSQRALAAAAGVPRDDVLRLESARAGEVRVERVRRVVDALHGRARLVIYYNGAAGDRLLDERHARLTERAVSVFDRRRWRTSVEVTFAEYGERGSIDVLAGHERSRIAAVCEVKASVGSLEEMNRTLDVKERLAPKLVKARFGWWPVATARILIVPEEMTIRRVFAAHASTMSVLYPARSREIRAWLRRPNTAIRGIWFLSEVARSGLVTR